MEGRTREGKIGNGLKRDYWEGRSEDESNGWTEKDGEDTEKGILGGKEGEVEMEKDGERKERAEMGIMKRSEEKESEGKSRGGTTRR